jgi:hypothetical protein
MGRMDGEWRRREGIMECLRVRLPELRTVKPRRRTRSATRAARGRNGCANGHARGGARAVATTGKNKYQVKPHPGFYVTHRDWPVFWLAVILRRSCLPVRCTVAYDRRRQAYSSGGCAGLARDENPARHRLPVSPSRRQAGGHHSRFEAHSTCDAARLYSRAMAGRGAGSSIAAALHHASCRVYAHRINIFHKLDFKLPSRLLLTLSCTAPTGPNVRGHTPPRHDPRPHACRRRATRSSDHRSLFFEANMKTISIPRFARHLKDRFIFRQR